MNKPILNERFNEWKSGCPNCGSLSVEYESEIRAIQAGYIVFQDGKITVPDGIDTTATEEVYRTVLYCKECELSEEINQDQEDEIIFG